MARTLLYSKSSRRFLQAAERQTRHYTTLLCRQKKQNTITKTAAARTYFSSRSRSDIRTSSTKRHSLELQYYIIPGIYVPAYQHQVYIYLYTGNWRNHYELQHVFPPPKIPVKPICHISAKTPDAIFLAYRLFMNHHQTRADS